MKGRGEFKGYDSNLPTTDIPGKTILVIDDICDSGHTLLDITRFYEGMQHEVMVAALYYKTGAVIRPDFFWQRIPEDGGWVTFPWEG
jgi:hypoxanthine phosphoribosyltransferase